MSADNWTHCPRCKRGRREAAAAAVEKARAAYGVVSAYEFDELRRESDRLVAQVDTAEETFREDYEIYGAATGVVRVGYRGECTRCGLLLRFEHEHPVEPTAPDRSRVGPVWPVVSDAATGRVALGGDVEPG